MRRFERGEAPNLAAAGASEVLAAHVEAHGPVPCQQSPTPEAWDADPTARGAALLEHAREGCARCPVRGACLLLAIAADERHGVWGGKTRFERLAMSNAEPA